jgi:hypothetical protein
MMKYLVIFHVFSIDESDEEFHPVPRGAKEHTEQAKFVVVNQKRRKRKRKARRE